MSYETRFPDWKQRVIEASEISNSASEAAGLLSIKYDTYKKYAQKYGCFKTNQSGKGTSKLKIVGKIPTEEILNGLHPQYQSNKLRKRLISENILEEKCSSCGLTTWLSGKIPLELDHINGNNSDHVLSNLRLLCPNCHALTDNYRGKNTRINKV